MQLTLEFSTQAPINQAHLTGQNRKVYNHLASGRTITNLEARELYNVLAVNSRISDLRNVHGIRIYDRFISVSGIQIKEYSLKPF